MTVTFPFDRQFQVGLLAMMVQRHEFLTTAVDLLRSTYFEDRVLAWIFQAICDHFRTYDTAPSGVALNDRLQRAVTARQVKDADAQLYRDVIVQLQAPVVDQRYLMDEVVRFCRRTAMRNLWVEKAKTLDQADDAFWDDVVQQTQLAAQLGTEFFDLGMPYFETTADRLRRRAIGDDKIRIPTGITDLDYKIGGGLKGGQLGVWLGGTGQGKSIALPHCGKRAIVGGYKVLHYTLELDEEDVAERYDAAWSFVPVHELVPQAGVVQARLDRLFTRYGNALVIKHFPTRSATVGTLRSHLKSLASTGFTPDLIIVDYGDLLRPQTSYEKLYDDLGTIFADLRGLAGDLRVPIWTATQANRAGLNAEVVDLEFVADSLQKVQIADLVIAICANRDELENNQLRLFGAKNRNGPPKFSVPICSAYDRMCFFVPGEVTSLAGQGAPPPPVKRRRRAKSS